jgi:hypothetical protein
MSSQDSRGVCGDGGSVLSAKEVISRLQELVDTRPVGTAIPIEWAVSAYFLGDVNGLACLSLRAGD